VVPLAGQDAVVETAAVKRKAHVGTAIVEREDAAAVVDDEDRAVRPTHDNAPPGLELLKPGRAHEIGGRNIHRRSCLALVHAWHSSVMRPAGLCTSDSLPEMNGLPTSMMDLFGRAAKFQILVFEILVSGRSIFSVGPTTAPFIQPHLMAAFGAATWSMPDLHRSERALARGPSIADGRGSYGDAGTASRCGAPGCAGDDQTGRPRRIGWRPHNLRDNGERDGGTRCQMQTHAYTCRVSFHAAGMRQCRLGAVRYGSFGSAGVLFGSLRSALARSNA
jgi:hypothetical protein